METSHPLSIESFSYSWLVNLNPSSQVESLDSSSSFRTSLDAYDEASSFIEMDPRMPSSRRFFINSQDFKFDFPTSQSPLNLVDADQLFSNGYLMPFFVESLKIEQNKYDSSKNSNSISTSASSSSSHVTNKVVPLENSRSPSLKRCRTLSRRLFQKYLNFLRPLCRRLRGRKSGSKHENLVKRTQSLKNIRGNYCESSPRISVAYSADDWRRVSCDSDNSIYEAVLHCKRSIGEMRKYLLREHLVEKILSKVQLDNACSNKRCLCELHIIFNELACVIASSQPLTWDKLFVAQQESRLGFRAVEVEVDSLLVVNTLNSNKNGSIMGKTLVEKIRRLIQMNWTIVVRHSYRETN